MINHEVVSGIFPELQQNFKLQKLSSHHSIQVVTEGLGRTETEFNLEETFKNTRSMKVKTIKIFSDNIDFIPPENDRFEISSYYIPEVNAITLLIGTSNHGSGLIYLSWETKQTHDFRVVPRVSIDQNSRFMENTDSSCSPVFILSRSRDVMHRLENFSDSDGSIGYLSYSNTIVSINSGLLIVRSAVMTPNQARNTDFSNLATT